MPKRDKNPDNPEEQHLEFPGFDEDGASEADEADVMAAVPGEGRRLQLIPHSVDPNLVFRFEFGPAILAQVLEKISALPQVALEGVTVRSAAYPGFYQLFQNGESKYIGRTIRPVGARLREHVRKLRGRIPLAAMTCRYLFVEDLSLVGLSEDSLIAYFHPLGLDEWGKMGFGSKATGHGRAGQTSEWHAANPPDLNWLVTAGGVTPRTLRQLILEIARAAPLVISIPTKFRHQFDNDFPETASVPEITQPFSDWMTLVEGLLGEKWRIDRQPMAWYVVPL
jgi:hypothetical protein